MMKKIGLTIAVLCCTLSMMAQKGEKAIGGSMGYATEVDNIGIGWKFQYFISDDLRAEANSNYFFNGNHGSMLDFNLNAQYVIDLNSKMAIYPFIGPTFEHWGNDDDVFGMNLGCGFEYHLPSSISLFAESKSQLVKDYSKWVCTFGVKYRF